MFLTFIFWKYEIGPPSGRPYLVNNGIIDFIMEMITFREFYDDGTVLGIEQSLRTAKEKKWTRK